MKLSEVFLLEQEFTQLLLTSTEIGLLSDLAQELLDDDSSDPWSESFNILDLKKLSAGLSNLYSTVDVHQSRNVTFLPWHIEIIKHCIKNIPIEKVNKHYNKSADPVREKVLKSLKIKFGIK